MYVCRRSGVKRKNGEEKSNNTRDTALSTGALTMFCIANSVVVDLNETESYFLESCNDFGSVTLPFSSRSRKLDYGKAMNYEFKPASIDKNQRGTLHKNKDNKVSVEFQNIQPGKPKVTFEGTSEDCKDNDAVLFFDGEPFRLERVHCAVKRLRHNRKMGESAGPGVASVGDLEWLMQVHH
ncbi:hypothetical protein SASPL_125356 [Salvia splendens]|uniref:Transcription elongation factor Eaf N-terminal domain-containing protein n=1 Tax=Salvia splendens TaxID=180675 RepID=A0A8X8XH00_SALSN|nr:hypothetical protein SASPL_125356 [Salvia splendens]